MDYGAIMQAIGSLGFPIVMCLLLYNRMDKQDAVHREEMDKLTTSLNNNTLALTQLTSKLDLKGELK